MPCARWLLQPQMGRSSSSGVSWVRSCEGWWFLARPCLLLSMGCIWRLSALSSFVGLVCEWLGRRHEQHIGWRVDFPDLVGRFCQEGGRLRVRNPS